MGELSLEKRAARLVAALVMWWMATPLTYGADGELVGQTAPKTASSGTPSPAGATDAQPANAVESQAAPAWAQQAILSSQGSRAFGPMLPATGGFVAYRPIEESVLPATVSSPSASPAATALPAQTAQPANLPTVTNLGAPAINWGPYTLGPDDVVHVAVRNQPEFTGTYVIGPDGEIQFGFIGDVPASGLTKEELARAVEERLKRYIRIPSVYVTIVGFNSKAIYILGRVARPGKYAMRGDSIKIRDAVIAAGLVVQHAKLRNVHIVKSDPTNPTYRVVDLFKVLYKGKMDQNVDLVAGDIVVVPTTVWGGISDFLNALLSPVGHAGSVAALAAL